MESVANAGAQTGSHARRATLPKEAVNRLPLTVDRPPFSGDSRSLFFVFFALLTCNFTQFGEDDVRDSQRPATRGKR